MQTGYKQANLEFERHAKDVVAEAIDLMMAEGGTTGTGQGQTEGPARISAKEVVEKLNRALGYDSGVESKHVTDWRTGRSLVPLRLWQPLSAALWNDPTRLAQLTAAIPDTGDDLAEALALHHSLDRLRAQQTELADEVLASPSRTTGDLVSAVGREDLQGKWQVAISPAYEGPAGYVMHVADRVDFRRKDGSVGKSGDLEADLFREFGLLNVQPSQTTPGHWAPPLSPSSERSHSSPDGASTAVKEDDGPDPYLRYSIGFTASPFPPPAALPYRTIRSISVVSAESILWPSDVGAMLARLLGFGFTSTQAISRTSYGFGYSEQMAEQRNLVHRQLLAQPWRRYVWSHRSAPPSQAGVLDLLPLPDQVPPDHLLIVLRPSKHERPGGQEDDFYSHLHDQIGLIRDLGGRAIELDLPVIDRKPERGIQEKWERTFKAAFTLRKRLHHEELLSDSDYQFARAQLADRSNRNIYSALAKWDRNEFDTD